MALHTTSVVSKQISRRCISFFLTYEFSHLSKFWSVTKSVTKLKASFIGTFTVVTPMVVSKLVTFTPTKTQAVHLYCDSLSLPYKISPFLPPESVWTDYADTIIKFSPIDRFPISIAVEAKLNLAKSTDLT